MYNTHNPYAYVHACTHTHTTRILHILHTHHTHYTLTIVIFHKTFIGITSFLFHFVRWAQFGVSTDKLIRGVSESTTSPTVFTTY